MTVIEWVDTTRYALGQPADSPERIGMLTANIGDLRVIVTRGFVNRSFMLHAHDVDIISMPLNTTDVEAAKRLALQVVSVALFERVKMLMVARDILDSALLGPGVEAA